MGIKAIIEKLEDVDEKYRDLYTEKNGKFELTGVEGMRTEADVTRLQTSLEKERKDHKESKAKWAALGDRKPDEVIALLDRIPELEAAAGGKLDENKINELVEKRIGSKVAPLERKVKELSETVVAKDNEINAFKTEKTSRTIQDAVREAVGKVQGFQSVALEDALLFGERHLHLNEEGKVVTKENVGVTPGIDASVWLTEMQQRKPHWWGPTGGGGASGSGRGNANSGKNPFTHEHWNLTEQGQLIKENRARAEQMAKSAGTTIGGKRPEPKK